MPSVTRRRMVARAGAVAEVTSTPVADWCTGVQGGNILTAGPELDLSPLASMLSLTTGCQAGSPLHAQANPHALLRMSHRRHARWPLARFSARLADATGRARYAAWLSGLRAGRFAARWRSAPGSLAVHGSACRLARRAEARWPVPWPYSGRPGWTGHHCSTHMGRDFGSICSSIGLPGMQRTALACGRLDPASSPPRSNSGSFTRCRSHCSLALRGTVAGTSRWPLSVGGDRRLPFPHHTAARCSARGSAATVNSTINGRPSKTSTWIAFPCRVPLSDRACAATRSPVNVASGFPSAHADWPSIHGRRIPAPVDAGEAARARLATAARVAHHRRRTVNHAAAVPAAGYVPPHYRGQPGFTGAPVHSRDTRLPRDGPHKSPCRIRTSNLAVSTRTGVFNLPRRRHPVSERRLAGDP